MLINKNIFNVSEAAFILGLSASTVYKFFHTGVIKAFKYNNRYAWYITVNELQRYLAPVNKRHYPPQRSATKSFFITLVTVLGHWLDFMPSQLIFC